MKTVVPSQEEMEDILLAETPEAYLQGLQDLLDDPDLVGEGPILLVPGADGSLTTLFPTWRYTELEILGILQHALHCTNRSLIEG